MKIYHVQHKSGGPVDQYPETEFDYLLGIGGLANHVLLKVEEEVPDESDRPAS